MDAFLGHGMAVSKNHHVNWATMSSIVPEYRHYNSTLAPDTAQLQGYQSKHASIASSFESGTFSPLPIVSNRHLQTIGGVFLRNYRECAYVRDRFRTVASLFDAMVSTMQESTDDDQWYYDERERIVTPSRGSFFTVDHKYSTTSSKGRVLVLHGLESNSNSTLCMDMSNAFLERGYDVSVIHFRGCCGSDVAQLYKDGTLVKNSENPFMYHLGFVDDVIYYLSVLASRNQKQPIYLSGFSLGANVVLKALGQLGSDAIDLYNVAGAAVAGAPFDTEKNYMQFHNDPISRWVYVENLLAKLKWRADKILTLQYDGDVDNAGFDYRGSMDATTIYELETACVAPLFGFEDHIDYYRKTSCGYFIERICVPTYVVNARDDPFFDSSFVPWDKVYGGESGMEKSGGGSAPVKIAFTEQGGHLGYIFHQVESQSEDKERKASWISEELARFIDHAHEEMFPTDSIDSTTVVEGSSLPLL